jgi:hypothetical protein
VDRIKQISEEAVKQFLLSTFALAALSVSASASIVSDLAPSGGGGSAALIDAAYVLLHPFLAGQEGNYSFEYDIDLAANSQVEANHFLVFYDVTSYVTAFYSNTAGNAIDTNWALSTPTSGGIPPLTLPPDNSTVLNVQFTYSGPTVTNAATAQDLGAVYIVANSNILRSGFFGQDSNNASGGQDSGVIQTDVPGSAAIPEPASMSIMGSALAGVAFMIRRRR